MTKFKNTSITGIMLLSLGAIAFITNPPEQSYQKYATVILRSQLKEKVCTQVTEELGAWLDGQCQIMVNTASPYLAQVISQQTNRQNLLLFSIYQADLPFPDPLPTYHIETIGILGNFYTYQTKKL
jgi:hypothetical protein